MKIFAFVLVFGLLIFILWKIYQRSAGVFPKWFQPILKILFLVGILLQFIFRAIPNQFESLRYITHLVGSYWLVLMSNALWVLLVCELIRQILIRNKHLKQKLADRKNAIQKIVVVATLSFSTSFFVLGMEHAKQVQVKKVQISSEKIQQKSLNIVAFSDVHFDPEFGYLETQKMVHQINELKPDLILFIGDMSDLEVPDLNALHIGSVLDSLKAPMGIFGVPGNHAYYVKTNPLIQWMNQHGIQILVDSTHCLKQNICITGRDDLEVERKMGVKRKSLETLSLQKNPNSLWVLLDHRPAELEKAAKLGVDLMLSGHTHDGQFWPWNYLVRSIFRNPSGALKVNQMMSVVSSGYGTWGPPVRVGTQADLLQIKITGN